MMFDFKSHDIKTTLVISNEFNVILFDCSGKYKKLKKSQKARNIYAIDGDKNIIWRVSSPFDEEGCPFIEIYIKDKKLRAYRWDGSEYIINLDTGEATPYAFLK